MVRDKKKMDIERYRDKIANINWEGFYESGDVNWVNNFLEEKLREILDSEAPLKGFQARRKHHNWLNQEMKEMMRVRDIYKITARQTGDPAHRQLYKRWRNDCAKELTRTKNKYFKEMFGKLEQENDTKQIYGVARKLMNWKKWKFTAILPN